MYSKAGFGVGFRAEPPGGVEGPYSESPTWLNEEAHLKSHEGSHVLQGVFLNEAMLGSLAND